MNKLLMCFLFVILTSAGMCVETGISTRTENTIRLPTADSHKYCLNEDGTWCIELNFKDHLILLNSTGFYERIDEERDLFE